MDALIKNSALTRYLVYNLRLGEVIKKISHFLIKDNQK